RAELEREKAQVQAAEERKRAEVEQARADEERKRRQAEQAQVLAERKRRRVQRWFALALVVFMVGGAGAGVGLGGGAGGRTQQVRAALAQADSQLDGLQAMLEDPRKVHVLLSDPQRWENALQAALFCVSRIWSLPSGELAAILSWRNSHDPATPPLYP